MTNTLIGVSLHKPRKASERPRLRKLYCKLDDPYQNCPVLKRKQCICCQFLSRDCIFGYRTGRDGWTKRAQKYRAWVKEAEAEKEKGPRMPKSPDRKMAFIGDYVWLPYSHMAMCEHVPFLAHGGAFRTEQPFVKAGDFTVGNIVKLIRFKPQAMMGGTIRVYQNESVPAFLYDLMYTARGLYDEVAKVLPEIVKRTPDYTMFRNAPVPIKLVKPGTMCLLTDKWEPFVWYGKDVTVKVPAGFIIGLWNYGLSGDENLVELRFKPNDATKVLVLDDKELLRLYQAGVFAK